MTRLRIIALGLGALVLCVAAFAQDATLHLADFSSSAMLPVQPLPVTPLPPEHKFFDRQQLLGLYVHSGVRLADTIKTCRSLAHGGTEEWIPTQSCGGVIAWQAGAVGLALGVGWLLHRHGDHRLERMVPWVGTGASAAGLTKSVFNIR